jgi:D-alanyl-lipoteichoic acid acyltransferase DltB (MBOAT superfamily)
MNFTQSAFFVLLAFAIAAVAVTTRGDIRKVIILGCSFVFYGWWDWRFLGLVLVSTTIDFLAGLLIESSRRSDDQHTAKLGLGVAVAANLLILGVFKYFDFFSLSIGFQLGQQKVGPEPRQAFNVGQRSVWYAVCLLCLMWFDKQPVSPFIYFQF